MATNYHNENTNSICNFTFSPETSGAFREAVFTCTARFFAVHVEKESNVWIYVFNQPHLDSYTSPISCEDRACHLDDIPYPFLHPNDVAGVEDSYFRHLSDLIVSYIGSFVRTANPYSRGVSPKWSRYNAVPQIHVRTNINRCHAEAILHTKTPCLLTGLELLWS